MAKRITPQELRKKVKQLTKRFRELEQDESVTVSIERQYGTNYQWWRVTVFNSNAVIASCTLFNQDNLPVAIQRMWEDYNQRKKV